MSNHEHQHSSNKKILKISFCIIFTFMVVEAVGGFLTNSLALLSDAGHMLSDAVSLLIALIAVTISSRAATYAKTFGYYRIEILAAALNGLTLILIALFIFYESIERFLNPPEVASVGMLIISVVGLLVNISVALLMVKGADTKENLNMRGAFLHVLSDLLGSFGAMIAAILMMLFDWGIADPIASVIVAALVLRSGIQIMKSSIHVLMEGTPTTIDLQKVVAQMATYEQVLAIHDVHCWTVTSGVHALTARMQVAPTMNAAEIEQLLAKIKHHLLHENIQHSTIQVTTKDGAMLCTIERGEEHEHHGHHH